MPIMPGLFQPDASPNAIVFLTRSSEASLKLLEASLGLLAGNLGPVPYLDPEDDKRAYGYSRDHRGDCVQIVIALVVTPEGLPVAYEVMKGNTADNTTLTGFLDKIEGLYGRSRRIWLMDRGIPTEETLKDLASRGGEYVVGTPKGRLTKLESAFAQKPWQRVRDKVKVKLLEADEVIVFVESDDRHLVFSRYTTPEADQELVLDALGWRLPLQSPPKITKDGSVEMK